MNLEKGKKRSVLQFKISLEVKQTVILGERTVCSNKIAFWWQLINQWPNIFFRKSFQFSYLISLQDTGNVQLNKAQTLLSAKILYGGFNEFESDLCSNEHYL